MAATLNHNDIGDVWAPRFTFKVGTTPTDPTNVTFRLALPDGTTESVGPTPGSAPVGSSTHITGITRNGAGDYSLAVNLDAAGYWLAKASGTGAAQGSEVIQTIVDPDPFAANWGLSSRALVGLPETMAWLASKSQATDDYLTVVRLINAVSTEVYSLTRREFKVAGTNPQTRTIPIYQRGATSPRYIDGQYVGDFSDYNRMIKLGDMAAAPTQVQILSSDWTTVLETVSAGNITYIRDELDPVNGPIRWAYLNTAAYPISSGYQVKVTGTFGFPSVPEDVKQAVMDTVAYRKDRDVEHPRETLSAFPGAGDAGAAVILSERPMIVSFPPEIYATLIRYKDPVVG